MLRAFGHPIATYCDVLSFVGSNLKMIKFFMQHLRMLHDVVTVWPGRCNNVSPRHAHLFEFPYPTRRNTSQQGGQTRATCCAQQCCDMLRSNVAIVWPVLANAGPPMLGYVVLRCWDRLAGASDHLQMHALIACNSGRHFAGNSELFPAWGHSFRNVARSWHLVVNSFIVRCHVTMN